MVLRKINHKLLDFSYKHKLTFVLGNPTGIMMEPFSKCNYFCPLCPAGLGVLKRNKVAMSLKEFKQYIGIMKWTTEYITLYHFGEPLLSKNICDMVKYCHSYYIPVQISTNGSIYNEKQISQLFHNGLDRLIVSIDTPNSSIYPIYRRGGNFYKVENNIKKMISLKKKLSAHTRIVLQYMLMNGNENIEEMKKHGEMLGADEVLVKTIGIGTSIKDIDHAIGFLPQNDEFSRYSKINSKEIIAKYNGFICEYIWKRMLVCSDGQCVICVRDQCNNIVMGDLQKQKSLSKIWNSKKYRLARAKAKHGYVFSSMCQRCPEKLKYSLDPWVLEKKGSDCSRFKLN